MENPEEILHSLEEFSKTKPKDIPRELEEYLCFVAKTGDPVYQWSAVKSLFREKMINVITEFYETCPSVEIPPCPNVDLFNYDVMKNFILEKLDTFAAAPFTLQRICELLTTPRKEYNRIDKYMRALEKNILVVSTTEPGGRRATENGDGIMNGLESDHLPETSSSSNDINVEEMDDSPSWPRMINDNVPYQNDTEVEQLQETVVTDSKETDTETACTSSQDVVICRNTEEVVQNNEEVSCQNNEEPYVSIEPVPSEASTQEDSSEDVSVTITAIPAGVQKRRSSVEPVVSSETLEETTAESSDKSSEVCKEETSSSQQIEDADSSSSTEDDKERKDEKLEEIVSNELSSTENEEKNEVDTSDKLEYEEESNYVETDEQTVDTTKCSIEIPREESEISSSDKVEVHSSQDEEESKTEAETQEEKIEVCQREDEAMEVDFISENIEGVVQAEATSDSQL